MILKGDRKKLGAAGEAEAARMLRKSGHRVVAKNYRCAAGEIDIVARKKKLIIFVEVKTRATGAHASPVDAVDKTKQRHIISSAKYYLREKKLFDVEYRYDVVSVVWGGGPRPERVEHHEGAFSEGRS